MDYIPNDDKDTLKSVGGCLLHVIILVIAIVILMFCMFFRFGMFHHI
jgi:hypothetical protein